MNYLISSINYLENPQFVSTLSEPYERFLQYYYCPSSADKSTDHIYLKNMSGHPLDVASITIGNVLEDVIIVESCEIGGVEILSESKKVYDSSSQLATPFDTFSSNSYKKFIQLFISNNPLTLQVDETLYIRFSQPIHFGWCWVGPGLTTKIGLSTRSTVVHSFAHKTFEYETGDIVRELHPGKKSGQFSLQYLERDEVVRLSKSVQKGELFIMSATPVELGWQSYYSNISPSTDIIDAVSLYKEYSGLYLCTGALAATSIIDQLFQASINVSEVV